MKYYYKVRIGEEKMSLIPSFEIGIWNAWIFMIWLIISPILSSIAIKGKEETKRLRASATIKHEKMLNVISMSAVVFGFIYSIFLPLKLNTIWFYIGLIIFLIGLTIDFSVLFTFRKAKPDKPFTMGPYKYSRHPIYLALILIFLGVSIMSYSWIIIVFLIIIIMHLQLAVPAEELYCLKKYGKVYQDYLKRTPRWIGIPKPEKKP
jgi:protein-S-isoprenylcysteine O-methyltransferase Ste14